MNNREYVKNGIIISTDARKLQLDVIHNFLAKTYWAKDIPLDIVKKSLEYSLNFGIYKKNKQIGFARLVTDYATFSYLADVFILEEYRGLGLSKWMMEVIINYPELQGLRTWMLKTADAHGLYEKFGFSTPKFPDRVMEFSGLKNGYLK